MFHKYLPEEVRNVSGPTSPAVMRQWEADAGQLEAAVGESHQRREEELRRMG